MPAPRTVPQVLRATLATVTAFTVLASGLMAQGALQAPCFEPLFGTNLGLGDDAVALAQPLGFSFPVPGGTTTTTIGVSSNGFVWLDNSFDSGCCDGNEVKFLSRGPRIAALWADFDPSASGAVWFNTFPAAGTLPARAVITWDQVPLFQSGQPMTFQLQLFADGSVLLYFDPNTQFFANSPLTGITSGNGAVSNLIDILGTSGSPHDSGVLPSAYDINFGFFDLSGAAWTFVRNGQGGYIVTEAGNCTFASAMSFGIGCPKPATSYELFQLPSGIDLSNVALEFLPNGSGGYVCTQLPGFFTGFANGLALGDDDIASALALPFTFNYPGGSTNAIDVSSNGFVWLQPQGVFGNSRCCSGDENAFVSDPASIAVLWQDLYPPGAQGGGGVFFDVVGTTEVHITWSDVPEFFNQGSNTCQITLRSDGSFRLSYGAVANVTHDVLVGFSQGNGTTAPGSIDFSQGAFTTGPGGTPLRLAPQVNSRPRIGTTFTMQVDQITQGSALGVMVFGLSTIPGGLDLTFLGMGGCSLYATLDTLVPFALTGSPTSYAFPIANSSALIGVSFAAQAATLTPAATPLNLLSSNGLRVTLGY
jgi:hypothetical protein